MLRFSATMQPAAEGKKPTITDGLKQFAYGTDKTGREQHDGEVLDEKSAVHA